MISYQKVHKESLFREIFLSRPARPCGHTQHSVQCVPGLFFSGGGGGELKWPGRGVDQQFSSSAEVKETVDLYLYSPSGSSWSVLE